MNTEVKLVDPIEHFDQAVSLIEANWKESGMPIDFVAADARKFYEFMAANHKLFAAAAYQEDKVVGYAVITIVPHPLNHSVIICDCNGIYLIPDLRGGRIVADMMEAVRELAKEHKAHSVHWHASSGSKFVEALASRFIPVSNYFREVLDYE